MGDELDSDDVVAGHPHSESELKTLRDDLAMLRGALYDEQHGITATLRNDALDWYEYMAKQMQRATLRGDTQHMLGMMKELALDGGKKARDVKETKTKAHASGEAASLGTPCSARADGAGT